MGAGPGGGGHAGGGTAPRFGFTVWGVAQGAAGGARPRGEQFGIAILGIKRVTGHTTEIGAWRK